MDYNGILQTLRKKRKLSRGDIRLLCDLYSRIQVDKHVLRNKYPPIIRGDTWEMLWVECGKVSEEIIKILESHLSK